MSIDLFTPAAVVLTVITGLAGLAGPNSDDDDRVNDAAVVTATPPPAELTFVDTLPCEPLDGSLLVKHVLASGELRFVYPNDGVITCDEAMVVVSYAANGPDVDHLDPIVDQVVFQVAELEAAGAAGVTVAPQLDPCWAGVEVLRDGDTFVWDHVIGDGCELEVTSSFAGAPFATEIHVVQQTGNIVPPYMFPHDQDDTTVLTGLPNGTWYVKVYEGAVPATTMSVDGGTPLLTDTVYGVPDGSEVQIAHPDQGRRVETDRRITAPR